MKVVNTFIFRAICAIALGVVLLFYTEAATQYLVWVIGALFIIPGLVSIVSFFMYKPQEENDRPFFPIGGIGSLLLGLLMLFLPSEIFVKCLMYMLGGVLIIVAICQIALLMKLRKYTSFSMGFFTLPTLIILASVLLIGFLIVMEPVGSEQLILMLIGGCCILYGLSEIIDGIRFHKVKKEIKRIKAEAAAETTSATPETSETATASEVDNSSVADNNNVSEDAAVPTTSTPADAESTPAESTLAESESTPAESTPVTEVEEKSTTVIEVDSDELE